MNCAHDKQIFQKGQKVANRSTFRSPGQERSSKIALVHKNQKVTPVMEITFIFKLKEIKLKINFTI